MINANYIPSHEEMADRKILITGATSGIGRALSLKLSHYPCKLILLGRSSLKLNELKAVCDGNLAEIQTIKLDLLYAKGDDYQSAIDKISSIYSSIDCILHNAAILGDRSPIEHYDIGVWQQVIHINVTSTFILTRCLLPLLKKGNLPSITFTSSGVGIRGKSFWGAYSVSKFAIEGLSQILCDELKNTNIRVNTINPGPTNTNMRAKAYPAENKESIKGPDEVLSPYLYLLSPESKNINGVRYDVQKST
jgi:NAD(P)-dependent dehydrogenase (short-subunit alcohol dehydrogenase family)